MNMKKNIFFVATALLFLLSACSPYSNESTSRSSSLNVVDQPTQSPTQNSTISWNQADQYVGEVKTVCGPVVDSTYATKSNGKPTFLNLGKKYPDSDRFTVLIWGRDRDNFPVNPESYYFGETICATGLIQEYNGILEIEVSYSGDISMQ